MKILLDECVPWPMHGDLLKRAEGSFDLFITSDQNIRYQQNLTAGKRPSAGER